MIPKGDRKKKIKTLLKKGVTPIVVGKSPDGLSVSFHQKTSSSSIGVAPVIEDLINAIKAIILENCGSGSSIKKFPIPLPCQLTGKDIEKNLAISKGFIELAKTFGKQNKLAKAVKQCKQALEFTDRSEDYAPLVEIYKICGEEEKFIFASLVLGFLEYQEGKKEAAQEKIEKVLTHFQKNPKVQEIGIRYYEATRQKDKGFSLCVGLAETSLGENNPKKAIQYYEKALTLRPNSKLIRDRLEPLYTKTEKLHLYLACFCHLFSIKNFEEATHYYKRAKALDSKNPIPLLTHLTLLDKTKQPKKVRNIIRELVAVSSNNPSLYAYSLEKLLSFKGEMAKCMTTLALEVLTLRKEIEKLKAPKTLLLAPPSSSSSSVAAASSAPVAPAVKTQEIPEMAFGPNEWRRYFGEVGEAPPLPKDIDKILSSECSFWPDKRVSETHLLVFIPSKIDGKPLTLNLLGEIIKKPKSGHKTKYREYISYVKNELGDKSTEPHWVLMTKDVVPNSRSKTYKDQKALIASYAKKSGKPYELPNALDAAVAILMEHVQSGKRLYSDKPLTWTRCQELVNQSQWPVAIGGFSSEGLSVNDDWGNPFIRGWWGCAEVLRY